MKDITTFLTDLLSFNQDYPLLFTQFNFWAFFLLVMIFFCIIVSTSKKKQTLRNGYLFLVSLFFYYKTSGLFVLLLLLSTLLGYFVGIRMDKITAKGKGRWRSTLWMIIAVVINLGVLCYFKYAYFFTDIYNTLVGTEYTVINHLAQFANTFSSTPHFDADVIILPVGISFYTFQNISYIVDVYKHKIPHAGNVLDFGFYTTFFPQLVAGPIIRADQFIPQLYKPYFLSRRQFGIAVFWILNGLLKKIVLSDYLAVNFVDRVFDNPSLYTPFENISALFAYALQIYADFSGYTDIAIGVAMLMGFYLPLNFNSPYKATSPEDFWHRWHMSLSTWLRDYLYIPLGGNRKGSVASFLILGVFLAAVAFIVRTQWVTIAVSALATLILAGYIFFPKHRKSMNTSINNMDTMLLGGLWHGASYNFITWGALNGMGLLVFKYWKRWGAIVRTILLILIGGGMGYAWWRWPSPTMNFFGVWVLLFCLGTLLVMLLSLIPAIGKQRTGYKEGDNPLKHVWNIFMTFLFITFTWLFFRSGSNADPAEANDVAWNTALAMLNQIGSQWHPEQIPAILNNYMTVFILLVLGLIIHWLPARFKRRYRLWFAKMPLWLMAIAVVAVVFLVYQFITADLQPFIYFQF